MRPIAPILALLIVLAAPAAAFAHAHLDHAVPAVGSTVASAPQEIELYFTQNLEPAFSTADVSGPEGSRIDVGKAHISGNTMQVGLKAAGAGTYHVHWHALSVDTHKTEGSFTFNVGP